MNESCIGIYDESGALQRTVPLVPHPEHPDQWVMAEPVKLPEGWTAYAYMSGFERLADVTWTLQRPIPKGREVVTWIPGQDEALVAVTDEMVDRATLALTNELRRKHGLGPMASLDELDPNERTGFTADMRVALEAALVDYRDAAS